MRKYLTVKQAAEEIGVTPKTVRRWVDQRRFPSLQIAQNPIRIPLQGWQEFLSTFTVCKIRC